MDKQEIMDKWEVAKTFYTPMYEQCEEDWKFLHGEGQWDDKARKARDKGGKPCLVLNQLLPYGQQVVNDIRQARIAIRTSPVDDHADVETSEVIQGIIRNVERQSNASTAYTTASLNAVGAGIGWIKVRTDYADVDTFDQEAYIDRVLDFTSVMLDPASDAIDGSDAEYAFILDKLSTDRYEEEYGDRNPISFDGDYAGDDEVCIAEYFYKSYKNDTLYQIFLVDGSVQTVTQEQKDLLDENGAVVYEVSAERKVKICTVKHCILDGNEEPIEENEFPCKYIPIVPVIGEEVYVDGKREFHSIIRQAKDAQRMYNYHKSESTYVMALQPRTPYIAPKGSFKSYPNKWANANKENYSNLEYDVVYDKNGTPIPGPQRQPAPQGSQAMMQEALGAREDIRMAIGMPQANMGERSNEVSGIAVRNRQIEGDNATFHFVDNLAASISQVGRILVDIIPRLYSERTIARIIGEDGEEKNIPVNTPYVKEQGQVRLPRNGEQPSGIYKLGVGKYDVVCDVGASYSSKRQETADKLIQLVNAKPELADVTADLLFEALDLPMGKEIAERLKASMDPDLLGDDPQAEKLKKAAQTLKQMQEQLLNYEAALQDKKKNEAFEQQAKAKELEIESAKTKADIDKKYAEIEKMRAETQGFNIEAVQALGGAVQGIAAQVNDIGEAVSVILDAKENEAPSEPVQSETP